MVTNQRGFRENKSNAEHIRAMRGLGALIALKGVENEEGNDTRIDSDFEYDYGGN